MVIEFVVSESDKSVDTFGCTSIVLSICSSLLLSARNSGDSWRWIFTAQTRNGIKIQNACEKCREDKRAEHNRSTKDTKLRYRPSQVIHQLVLQRYVPPRVPLRASCHITARSIYCRQYRAKKIPIFRRFSSICFYRYYLFSYSCKIFRILYIIITSDEWTFTG